MWEFDSKELEAKSAARRRPAILLVVGLLLLASMLYSYHWVEGFAWIFDASATSLGLILAVWFGSELLHRDEARQTKIAHDATVAGLTSERDICRARATAAQERVTELLKIVETQTKAKSPAV